MSATKARQQLLNWPALLFMGAAVILALVQLFPRQPAFRDPANLSAKDHLSIAYMRVLVRSDPENGPLRLSFVRVLTEAGFDDEALDALTPLLRNTPGKLQFETGLALVRLDLQRLFRRPPAEQAQTIRTEIVRAFYQLLPKITTTTEQDDLLTLARDFGDPAVLAELHARMAADAQLPAERRALLFYEAAQFSVAAGHVLPAARLATQAFLLRRDGPQRQDDAILALRSFLAASAHREALPIATDAIKHFPDNITLLLLGADIAQAQTEERTALNWLLRVREYQSTDVALQERILRLQLSMNELDAAYVTAQQLSELAPLSVEQRELIARTFDWNNDLTRSAPMWTALALEAASPDREARAFAIAHALGNDADIVALVESSMQHRLLSADESAAYLRSALRLFEPSRAQQQLNDYLRRQPSDRAAWQALAQLYAATGATADHIAATQRVQNLTSLSVDEKLGLAHQYWRNNQADAALNVLLSINKTSNEQALRYWRLLADIAWYLERDTLARSAYQQVLAKLAADDATAIARLLILAERSGRLDEVERLAEYGWRLRHEKVYFVRLLELAYQNKNEKWLTSLLAEADALGTQMHDVPQYWQFKAEMFQAADNRIAAEGALKRLYSLRLHDAEVVEAIGWTLLAKTPNDRTAIYALVDREHFLAQENADVAELFAAMQLTLAQTGKAEALFSSSIARRHHDFFWMLLMADNLEWLGCAQSANQARVLALGNLAATMTPTPELQWPTRLADRFHGRLDVALPEDEDDYLLWQRWAMLWQLPLSQMDNSRQFSLTWLSARLELDEWQSLAEDIAEKNVEAVRETVWQVAEQLQQFPLEPGAVLPLTLNEVAAGGSRRPDPKLNVLQKPDAAVCVNAVNELQQYSDRLIMPRSVAEKKSVAEKNAVVEKK